MILIGIQDQHDIGWLDVAMDQFLAISRDESARYLPRYSQRKICRERALALNAAFDSFPFHILHRIEESPVRITEVENCGNVWMP